jgi:hypothetical protein
MVQLKNYDLLYEDHLKRFIKNPPNLTKINNSLETIGKLIQKLNIIDKETKGKEDWKKA